MGAVGEHAGAIELRRRSATRWRGSLRGLDTAIFVTTTSSLSRKAVRRSSTSGAADQERGAGAVRAARGSAQTSTAGRLSSPNRRSGQHDERSDALFGVSVRDVTGKNPFTGAAAGDDG